jgi:steroid 5-alpha reductase family enzyme
MTLPFYFRLINGAASDAVLWVGLGVMVFGFLVEAAADFQKSKAKKKNSHRFVDTGLFRIVRCPNYLGELLIWVGVLLTGVSAFQASWQWILSILGFLMIAWIMFSGARRLEIRQDRNYGEDPEYQKYKNTVPILIPFIPLYSVKKYSFLVA